MTLRHLALAAAFAATCATAADEYPHKPIRMIDPYAPGGSTEAQARTIGQKLTDAWGEPVVIDGRPGAGSAIGSQIVANAPPDGYTLLFNNAAIGTTANMMRKPLYDPVKDLSAVILVGTQPFILVAHPSMPGTVKELVALAKAKPGTINFASAGSGGASHLAMEYLKSLARIDIVHVPYKGGSVMVTDLLGGRVNMGMANLTTVLPHLRAGRLQALAIGTRSRSPLMPDMPTLSEAGVTGYEANNWNGVVVPRAPPRPIVETLNRAIVAALNEPQIAERVAAAGLDVIADSPAEFARYLKSEADKWGRVVKRAGIRAE